MTTIRIGHRGAAGYEPENTLCSFRRAISIGVDFVETDLQQTADGHLVVMHDKRVDRTSDGTGLVASMTLEELEKLDVSRGNGERVPTLDELLSLATGRVGLMLEIITPGIGREVAERVRTFGFDGPVIYASFYHAELLAVEAVYARAARLALIECVPIDATGFVRDAHATHVGLALDSVTPQFVNALRGVGTQVFVYTANDPRDIAMLKSLPVDGIISDFPDRI